MNHEKDAIPYSTWQQLRDDPDKRKRAIIKWHRFQTIRMLYEPSFMYRRLFERIGDEGREPARVVDIPKAQGRPERYRVRNTNLDIVAVEVTHDQLLEFPESSAFHIARMLQKHGINVELAEDWPIIRFENHDRGGLVFIQIRERLTNGENVKKTII